MRRLPPPRTTPVRRWQPLSDAEWAALAPFLAHPGGPGRPLPDARARMDGIFLVAAGCPWVELPPHRGKPDMVGRHFRRLAHAGVWEALLRALAAPDRPAPPRALEHRICHACRRTLRLLGVPGTTLARRLGLLPALPASPWMPPAPDLSEAVQRVVASVFDSVRRAINAPALGRLLRLCTGLLRTALGRRRIPRRLEPA